MIHSNRLRMAGALFAALAVSASALAQSPVEKLRTFRYGADRSVLDAVDLLVKECRSNPSARAALAAELGSVVQSDAPYDARQYACRQLAFIGGEAQVPALAALLTDKDLSSVALLALARIPSKSVGPALLAALPRADKMTQGAIMDTLGDLHVAAAAPLLASRLAGGDAATQAAAAYGLAKFGDANAAAKLQAAYAKSTGATKAAIGDALLYCSYRMRTTGNTAGAEACIKAVNTGGDARARASALRELVMIRGARATGLVTQALMQEGTAAQQMAASLLLEAPVATPAAGLVAALPRMPAGSQVFVLNALAERRAPVRCAAVLPLCESPRANVRYGALKSLGQLGDATAVPALLRGASSAIPAERDVARESLTRLRGQDVDTKLIAATAGGAPKARVEAILALGRRTPASLAPKLVALAKDKSPLVSAAALATLRTVGTPADVSPVLDLLLAAPVDARDEARDTVSELARKGKTDGERTGPILKRLASAQAPADQAILIGVAAEVGGPAALTAISSALKSTAPEVQGAALRALAEWPTDEPLEALLAVVQNPASAKDRAIALRGAIRMFALRDAHDPTGTLELYKGVAASATSADEKRLILSGLAKLAGGDALEYASTFRADSDVRAEAELAMAEIGRASVGAYPEQVKALLTDLAANGADQAVRAKATQSLAMLGKFGDFIVGWELSPLYEGAGYQDLFEKPFAPEQAGHENEVPWRLMPAGLAAEQPWLMDILAVYPGEQKVAYLRTRVKVETERDLRLEIGSDDGPKVWWNGEMVFANNVARAAAPAQDKVVVHARSGWNTLMIKVSQNVMGWGLVARLVETDGTPATGLVIDPRGK